jgi:cell division protein FtsB
VTPARWATAGVLLLALYFALEGGEYGTRDWLELRRRQRSEAAQVGRLVRVVDSLERAAVAVERDPRVQERIAREEFGMIRKGEFLYKLVQPDVP